MKLQPESKKELTRIACGTAICTAVMWVIFALRDSADALVERLTK